MLSKSPFDANLTPLIFRENKKCSDETNRQSFSFILHHPRYLNNKSDRCGSPNQSCKKSRYRNSSHPAVTSAQKNFSSPKAFCTVFCTGAESVCVQMCPINSSKYLDFLTKICYFYINEMEVLRYVRQFDDNSAGGGIFKGM